jgi:CRISPR-associated endonuclease/helicase Cas3
LARSVIILDEAQAIPLPLLRPCLAAIDELARNYGASVVLCTATQPAVAAPQFQGGLALGLERELAPEPMRLHRELKRVRVVHVGERRTTISSKSWPRRRRASSSSTAAPTRFRSSAAPSPQGSME